LVVAAGTDVADAPPASGKLGGGPGAAAEAAFSARGGGVGDEFWAIIFFSINLSCFDFHKQVSVRIVDVFSTHRFVGISFFAIKESD
jgi:hypothetical protein